jgi:YidC/Oxa1 family membrane protein insertase
VVPGTEEKASFFGGVGNESVASCAVGDKVHKRVPGNDDEDPLTGKIRFFGVNQQYFLAALFPLEGATEGRCTLVATESSRRASVHFPLSVAPGQELTRRYGLYIGPKDVELLATVPDRLKESGLVSEPTVTGWTASFSSSRYPGLEETVDFGIWAAICNVLLAILKFFHNLFANWGIAVILLTVLVKLVLLPLTHKSMVSAEAMKKLQPQMEEIRKKYADDRNRVNVETMKLYQEAKVNPLGGCLPLLLQMPVWIALFTTLRNSYEIYREPFISPVWTDLTYKDPTYMLPLLLGITMIVTQKLQPQMMDPTQAKIMTYVMPVFFTAIMLNYPAGLSLYIFTNNVLSIAQQYGLRKYLERKGIAAPRVPATAPKTERARNERQSSRKRSDP